MSGATTNRGAAGGPSLAPITEALAGLKHSLSATPLPPHDAGTKRDLDAAAAAAETVAALLREFRDDPNPVRAQRARTAVESLRGGFRTIGTRLMWDAGHGRRTASVVTREETRSSVAAVYHVVYGRIGGVDVWCVERLSEVIAKADADDWRLNGTVPPDAERLTDEEAQS